MFEKKFCPGVLLSKNNGNPNDVSPLPFDEVYCRLHLGPCLDSVIDDQDVVSLGNRIFSYLVGFAFGGIIDKRNRKECLPCSGKLPSFAERGKSYPVFCRKGCAQDEAKGVEADYFVDFLALKGVKRSVIS
ncbi:TPA: hypothetical protein HA280_04975 [Candidatus Woesearchaeota archaeon]|nr:hypothetical protein [Candidatus Woesearchaeota archaeon]